MDRKIVLIDGYSLLFRAFHALPLMDNGEGEYTNAVYGFMNMLLKVLSSEQPQALAVAFDVDKHTFRHESYADYKAGRAPTPEEMKGQVERVKELLGLMNIAVFQKQGYEADDVLGTISRVCEEEGIKVVIVTGDRDSYQLAGENTCILYTKKGISETETVTPEWIREKYALEPRQLIDVKSLMGDASDNIPGVSGIGEKTAVKLIVEYGSLENLLAKAEAELKGAVKEKIVNGKDSAVMSRFLSEIDRHVPLEFSFEDCLIGSLRGALPLLRKLKLRTIVEKINEIEPSDAGESADKEAKRALEVSTLDAEAFTETALNALKGAQYASLYAGSALSFATDAGVCLKCELGGDLLTPGLSDGDIGKILMKLSGADGVKFVFHNLKAFDCDISVFESRSCDTMLAAYVLNPQAETRDISAVCDSFGVELLENCPAMSLIELWKKQEEKLKNDELMQLYLEIELPLCFVLKQMEQAGFRVDAAYLKELGKIYASRIEEISRRVYARAGREFNINSPKQLKQLLFDEMKLPVPGGKKNASSTAADVLESLAGDYPICADILEYRKYQKLQSTYVEGLLGQIAPDGRVHTRFEQAVTGTGRISSREPNLQNIPVRTELGREIRRAFIPEDGCVLVDADYSQIELRVLAAMSGDQGMQQAFRNGVDIHQSTASEVFGIPLSEVSAEMRSRAKAVNFGVVYGISEFGLARNTGTGVREAASFIERYFTRYPAVKRFMDEEVRKGYAQGYVKTLMGRRRYLPELKSENRALRAFGERAAMNSPIQGTAADIIKIAMVNTVRALRSKNLKSRLIMQVHDELIMEAPIEEKDEAVRLLRDAMENAAKLSVPLLAEAKTGGNWNECKP